MNGILVLGFLLGTALPIVAQKCKPEKCQAKQQELQSGLSGDEFCRAARDYMVCQEQVMSDCGLDASLLEPVKKMLNEAGCNNRVANKSSDSSSSGGLASISTLCLSLSVLLCKLVN